MSLEEKNTVESVVEHCRPVSEVLRGDLLAVHKNFEIRDTEKYQDGRNRIRGTFITPVFTDFKDYIDSKETTNIPVFVSKDNVKAVAILNYDVTGFEQGHCDHTATLELEQTVTWKKLNDLKGQKLNQKAFATLLEDWATVFRATTESGELIAINEAINTVRNMTIDSNIKVDTQVNNMSQSRSVLERVEAQSTIGKLPAYFEIDDPTYIGLDEKFIKLRLVVNSGESAPIFTLQIVKEELLVNEIIQEFKNKVIELLPDHQVMIGTFHA
ncbi:MAG: DUF2303 family protein [Paracoccus sp. (in: a-proteobacteria)]